MLRAASSRLKIGLLFAAFVFTLPAQDSASIEGTVVDSVTGTGIPDVAVYFGSDQGPHYDGVTDSSGRFQIAGMQDRQYGSHFEKSGYFPLYSGINESVLKPVRVTAGKDPIRLRVELVKFASVRGRVVDPDGKPVANASVTLGSLQKETTNDEGQFVFANAPLGSWTLQARPPDSRPHLAPAPGEDRLEIVPTWYPSTTESGLAERILVRGGANLSGYEIRLQSTRVYRVRGVVLGENGNPEPRAAVYNQPNTEQSFSVFGSALKGGPFGYFSIARSNTTPFLSGEGRSTKDGVFEFPSVPRGTSQFMALIETENGPPLPGGATVSAVVDHDIDNLELRLAAPFTIEGSVEFASLTGPAPADTLRQASVILQGEQLAFGLSPRGGSDGNLRFQNVFPGQYRVMAAPGLPGGYYLASISLGTQDVTGQSVSLQPGSPPFHIVYKPNAGTVTGTAASVDGAPADGVSVVLVPQASLDSLAVDFERVSPIGPGGGIEVDSVAPGTYYAFAVERRYPTELYDAQIARKIAASATLVQVAEGAAVSVKLKVIRLED